MSRRAAPKAHGTAARQGEATPVSELSRLALDHCPEMVMLVNPASLRIVLANAAAASSLGYEAGQLQGLEITEVEGALQSVFYWEEVRGGRTQEVQDQEEQYRKRDGEMLDVRKSIQLLEHEGALLLMVRAVATQSEHIAQDALAQALSALRATLESTSNAILVIDLKGHIESMNQRFGKMWAVPDDMLYWQYDARIFDFMVGRVVESELLRERLAAVMDNLETQDVLHLHEGLVFEMTSRPKYLGEQITGRVFGFQDITERMQVERELRESRDLLEERVLGRTADLHAVNEDLRQEKERQSGLIKRLEEAQNQLLQSERMASIGQLAAGVAHEINNPVGFVNSNLGSMQHYLVDLLRLLSRYEQAEGEMSAATLRQIGLLKEDVDIGFLRNDVTDLLTESLDGLKRITRIVQDLKSFSHVDDLERQWADLESGLETTLRVAWNEIKYKAEVIREFSGIPEIECFPFQLNQVFMNLLVNAAHAINERGTITIRTGHDDAAVWIEIQDTGQGIKAENLPRIFDPFFTTKPVGKGTGLGLSIAYGIVKKHGGEIEVRSEWGVGTCFKVTLPIKAASPGA